MRPMLLVLLLPWCVFSAAVAVRTLWVACDAWADGELTWFRPLSRAGGPTTNRAFVLRGTGAHLMGAAAFWVGAAFLLSDVYLAGKCGWIGPRRTEWSRRMLSVAQGLAVVCAVGSYAVGGASVRGNVALSLVLLAVFVAGALGLSAWLHRKAP